MCTTKRPFRTLVLSPKSCGRNLREIEAWVAPAMEQAPPLVRLLAGEFGPDLRSSVVNALGPREIARLLACPKLKCYMGRSF